MYTGSLPVLIALKYKIFVYCYMNRLDLLAQCCQDGKIPKQVTDVLRIFFSDSTSTSVCRMQRRTYATATRGGRWVQETSG
jgi:hypothetical protein